MQIRKKLNRHIKRLISIISVSLLFILLWEGLNYILVDDTEGYTRITFHEFYEQDKIDTLFMGASHVEVGLDTTIADEMLKENTFNLGTSSQRIDLTYLLLEEALSRYDVKHIYLDLSYNMATLDKSENMTGTYCVTDYLKPSLRKYLYLLNSSDEKNYANSIISARRDCSKALNLEAITELLKKKSTDEYRNYEYFARKGSVYSGKGYVEYDKEIDGKYRFLRKNYDGKVIENINENWAYYLIRIIELCEKNDVELTFISTPVSLYRLKNYGDYDIYIDHVKEIISEKSDTVRYIDFNLLKDEYWDDSIDLYYDASHLRKAGAEKFTSLFMDYLNGRYTDDELFYSSVKEKYSSKDPEVYGLIYEPERRGDNPDNVVCTIIGNRLEDIVTRVVLINLDGEEIIKDWSDAIEFEMLSWYEGKVNVEYASKAEPDNISIIELYAEGLNE